MNKYGPYKGKLNMAFTVDEFLNKNTNDFIKVEEGTFHCTIHEISNTTSKNNKPMVKMILECVDGPYKGGRFINYMSLSTEKTKYITTKILVLLAKNVFNVTEERLQEDAEGPNDLLNNAIAELNKKKSKAEVKVERKKQEGTEYYTNKIFTEVEPDDFIRSVKHLV